MADLATGSAPPAAVLRLREKLGGLGGRGSRGGPAEAPPLARPQELPANGAARARTRDGGGAAGRATEAER